ncbi:MAG: NAD(P)/FAD-dependent oxidoreductase [Niabella sp.]
MQQFSIWEQKTFFNPKDIIIVGAGFTGLWTALHLKEKYPNKQITILERGLIPSGASLRNAGFACFGSLTEIIADIKLMGVEKTLQLINMRYQGLKIIKDYFDNQLIERVQCGGYELLQDDSALNHINPINQLLYAITSLTETFVQKDALLANFGFNNIKHLIENPLEGAIDSGKLLQALTQLVISKGVQIFYNTELITFEEKKDSIEVHTNHTTSFQCRQIIFCTNAFTKKLFIDMDITPARGQVLLTEPIPNLAVNGVFHYDEGFYYFRNWGNRILLGGARNLSFETEYTYDDFTTTHIQQELEFFLQNTILPGQTVGISSRWAGIMAMGSDKFPIIKQLGPGIFCAVRLSGMGVALAPLAGKIVANELFANS